jgi:glucuronokinase
MDFGREAARTRAHCFCERIDPALLPRLYIAYREDLGKVSGRVLNTIRAAFDRGDKRVIGTLDRIAALAEEGRNALISKDTKKLHALINENFDLRSTIMNITKSNTEMVRTARKCGASAKFAGSGGSIIGVYDDEEMWARVEKELAKLGAKVIKPLIL